MKPSKIGIVALLITFFSLLSPRSSAGDILWGVMDWMNNPNANPSTDTSTVRPVFTDGAAHMVTHQYQGASWLPFKVSATNKTEIERIYGAGHCINLMLYFVNCTYDEASDTFSYPLSDAFLTDFEALVNAYKVGGGPLYIQVFPEFELWYNTKPAHIQDKYRARIMSHYHQMAAIARAQTEKAHIGLSFMGLMMADATSSFVTRWDAVMKDCDVVFVNFMTTFTRGNEHARRMVRCSKLIHENWNKPICFPYVMLWDDANTPIFTGPNYAADATAFSNYISSWVSQTLTAPAETEGTGSTDWTTNIASLKARGVFSISLYSANYCNKPVTPAAPNGVTYPLPSYGILTNVMSSNARTSLYPPVTLTTEKSYYLVSKQSGKHLHESSEVFTGNSAGKYAITYPAGSSWSPQKWKFVSLGSGNYRLVNWQSSNVLHESSEIDPANSSARYAITFPWSGWNTQRWKPLLLAGGEYRLESVESGKSLNESAEVYSSNSNGRMTTSLPYNGWQSQKWDIVPVRP